MIEYDEIENKMILKLVYYGPALSGKTTNLLLLHDLLEKEGRGDLTVLDTKDDRTRTSGMRTLIEDGIEKVKSGETTLEELIRVIGPQTKHERQCDNCNRTIGAKFVFCPYCETFKQNFCRQCMIPLEEDWNICPLCGLSKFNGHNNDEIGEGG